jgi:3-isopropylmalate dehydrogenase
MLLNWLGERHDNTAFKEAAASIDDAIDAVLEIPKERTTDLGGPLGTQAFAAVVADKLRLKPEI